MAIETYSRRMQTTYESLLDCFENWDKVESPEEKAARVRLLNLCEAIIYKHGTAYV